MAAQKAPTHCCELPTKPHPAHIHSLQAFRDSEVACACQCRQRGIYQCVECVVLDAAAVNVTEVGVGALRVHVLSEVQGHLGVDWL